MTAGEGSRELAAVLEEVRRVEVFARRHVERLAFGGTHAVFRGRGIEFDDVREYAEGDDPRSVDGNVTARTGRLHVKKWIDAREFTVLLLADLSPSMDGGFGPLSARQIAARAAACLALAAVRSHDRVGFVGFGAGVEHWVPPEPGLRHALRVLRDLLALRATPGPGGAARALDFAARAVKRRALVFVLSDFLDDGWRDAMARCALRHDVVALRLLLPELEPPETGLLRVRDPESGREALLDAGHEAVREAWRARAAAWRERSGRDVLRAGADLVDIPVPRTRERDAVSGPLRRYFRARERREVRS